ncbi:MAG: hypothetical protein KKF44_10160 [Nanoarchaeota archaeon]|nr:hypothetical protein [Nanoarchaeota archaeon]
MKSIRFIILFSFAILLSANHAYGVSIYGIEFLNNILYEPGQTLEYSYSFGNNDGVAGDYEIVMKGDLSEYFEISQTEFLNVQPMERKNFKIKIRLPDSAPQRGLSQVLVGVQQRPPENLGGIAVRTRSNIHFLIFFPYEFKYVDWSIKAENMNVNETQEMTFTVQNLGEPTIDRIYSDIDIINQDNLVVETVRSGIIQNLISRQKLTEKAYFNSEGFLPGDYTARFTLHWDSNISTQERTIKIGKKNVEITGFTDLFKRDAINSMGISIKSGWNTRIDNVYANVEIFDTEDSTVKARFQSLPSSLSPWAEQGLQAYFDTTGLEKNSYKAIITLYYDGSKTIKEGHVTIEDTVPGAVIVESPAAEGGYFLQLLRNNVLTTILVILVLANIILFGAVLISKKKHDMDEDNPLIHPKTIKEIKKYKQHHSIDDIHAMLKKKGWSEEHIKYIMKKIK